MGKFEKNRKAKPFGRIALVAVIVLVLVVLVLFVMPQVLYRLRGEDASQAGSADGAAGASTQASSTGETTEFIPVETESSVTFPMDVEDGKLRIENLVPFDGWNPDCGDQTGTDIAAIVVTNLSDTYLTQGDIAITTDDGRILHFLLTDIPSGGSVMAFETGNAAVGINIGYGDLTCQAQFDASVGIGDGIAVSVTGSHITLQNNTDEDMENLVVYCHGLLGDQYFGGITYTYTVNHLTAGGTAELDAEDCALGMVEVVRVEANAP